MNKLDTTQETALIGSSYTAETKEFVQQANIEQFKNVIMAIIGNNYSVAKVYLLQGCVATGGTANPTATTSGVVFFNGELYTVPASTLTYTGPQIAVLNLSVTNDATADPNQFSDNTLHNIHNVRQGVFAAGNTGTGTMSGDGNSDFENFIDIFNEISQYQAIGTVALTDNTGATEYTLATFPAVKMANKLTCFVNFQHTPSSSQAITLTFAIKVNGSAVYTVVYQQASPGGATYSKLANFHQTLNLAVGDIVTVTCVPTAASSGVSTVNVGEATLRR